MDQGWDALLHQYGYAAILLGTFLEGESILVAGGYFAQQGYLTLPGVVLAAFLGSFCGDQLFFIIGRRLGTRLLARFPKWQARVAQVHQLMERYHTAFILGFRFLYGLRTVSPFVLGTSDVTHRRFFVLNGLGAALWALTIGSAGYVFGSALQVLLERMRDHQKPILVGVACLVVVLIVVLRRRTTQAVAQKTAPPLKDNLP